MISPRRIQSKSACLFDAVEGTSTCFYLVPFIVALSLMHIILKKSFKSALIFLLEKKQLKGGVYGKCSRSLLTDVSNKAQLWK